MRLPKYTLTILASLVALGVLILAFQPHPVAVEVATVTQGMFEQSIDEDGITRVRQRYTVSAPLAGMLQRLPWKAGDAVTQGTHLATILPTAPPLLDVRTERELTARLGAAEATQGRAVAEVARAQAMLEQARADVQRVRQLAARGLVSTQQREQAELAFTAASRDLEAARQAEHAASHDVEVARAALLHLRGEAGEASAAPWHIYAPIRGQVLKVWQESAGVVAAGTPLLDIADASDLEVVVDVLTTEAARILPGTPVRLERSGLAQPLDGRVRLVEPAAFTKVSALGVEEQRVNVLIDLVSPPAQWQTLGDNYRIDARILVGQQDNVVQVPTAALFRQRQQWLVFVVEAGRAWQRAIEIGPRNALAAVVLQGLRVGEQVIVYPGDAVQDGVRIEPRTTGQQP